MTVLIEQKCVEKLPIEIINLIMNYAQRPQPKQLLNDIQNFYETRKTALDIYYKEWIIGMNEEHLQDKYWFINDIFLFTNGYLATNISYVDDFYKIFMRNPQLQNYKKIDDYLKKFEEKTVDAQINIFWGLLRPNERKQMLRESLAAVLLQYNIDTEEF